MKPLNLRSSNIEVSRINFLTPFVAFHAPLTLLQNTLRYLEMCAICVIKLHDHECCDDYDNDDDKYLDSILRYMPVAWMYLGRKLLEYHRVRACSTTNDDDH